MASTGSDPFYVYKEQLLNKYDDVNQGLRDFQRAVKSTNTATTTDAKDLKKKVKKDIKSCESTLKDLQLTVRLVEGDRVQFEHISDQEINQRRHFIIDMTQKLSASKSALDSGEVKDKLTKDERDLASRRGGDLGASNRREKENTDFIQDQQANAQMMMTRQDECLEDLEGAVERVGQIAGAINTELGVQNKMLKELESDVDEAEARMGVVMSKLGKLLQTKDGCQLGTIIGLAILLVVITFLVFYT